MKNTIYIDIHLSEVIYEVKQTTHIKNVTIDNEESFKTASNVQVDSETDQLTYRCVGNAYAELKSRLSEYVNEQGTTANNKLFDEDSNVSVVLYVPTNFNLAVKDSIAASMHQFMVATSIREWYTITSKEDAKDYRLTGDEAIKLIIANINKRLRLTRGTLPNYANDIKGGTFDAESNSIVFTNDLQKELFRITLPTDGTITNGYYDALTGIVHLKNPSQEDVFTIDLSPLKNAAKDYSLQSIVIENGNIVFKFNNDKSDITVPISSIVTLPDMSDYYTKDEVDDMFDDFTPGGGGTEQIQADWEQTDTTAKDYIKNKPDVYTKTEVNQLVETARRGGYILASELPTASADTMGKIYLIPKTGTGTRNIKDEYITIEENQAYAWEKIGDTMLDLSSYYQKPQTGIPLNDLASGVQTSLGKADSAMQRLVVIISYENNVYSSTETYAQIVTAHENGDEVIATYNDFIYRLSNVSNSSVTFEMQNAANGTFSTIDIANDDAVSKSDAIIPDVTGKEDKMILADNTDIVSNTLNADFGKYYNLGTLSAALTIALPTPSANETKLNGFMVLLTAYQSGTLPVTIPNGYSLIHSGLDELEANKTYEINFVYVGNSQFAATTVEMKSYVQPT